MAIKVQINGQYTKFSGNMKALAQLDKKLKFRHPGAFFIRKKMGRQWDGMIHPLTKADRIKTGLLEKSVEILSEFEEDFEVQDFRKHPQIKPPPDKINGLTLRPYQKESIETFLNNSVLDCPHRRGLGIMAVNSGKSLIYMGIHLSVVDAKTLLIVDNTPLYTQLVKDFSEVFPDTYGYMKGGDVKWGDIMVVMSKTLVNRLDVFKKELSSFNVMLVDEADLGSSNTHQTIYAGLSGISIRLGLTGTAFMRNLAKDKLRNNTMLEEFGEPLYEISMKELEDLGVSSKTVIKILNGTSPPMDIKKWKSQKPSFIDEFNEVISYNPKRHELILNRVLYNLRCGRDKIMVFNKFKDQTEILYEYIRKRLPKKYKIAFTHSGIKGDALERFRDGDVNVLISSLYLKRGLNIPKIKTLINNSVGEFPSNPLQILGRGTRKHSSKDRVYFEDFQDEGKFLASHSRRRISYYKDRGLEIRDLRVKK